MNRSLDQALYRRFMLTFIFVLGSMFIMGILAAGFATGIIGNRIGEASTIRLGTELAESEANLIGNSFGRVLASLSGDQSSGDNQIPSGAFQGLSDGGADSLELLLLLIGGDDLESLFDSIDFHHIALIGRDGTHLWSLGSSEGLSHNQGAFDTALGGKTASWFDRRVELTAESGEKAPGDLIESYVPLDSGDGNSSGLVFHMVRDITEVLESNVTATRNSIRNTSLVSMGLLLAGLALLVFWFDLRISRRSQAVIANERVIRDQLGTQNRELQRVDGAKNEFLASLSHELKTPLAAILGFTQILRRNRSSNLDAIQIQQLDIVERNSLWLDTLINDLLDLSKIQAGKISLTKEETEISSLLRMVVDGFETILGGKGQAATLLVNYDEAWMVMDQTRISQVLSNLLSNACKYSPDGSSITVTSRLEGDECVISVADEGMGISQEDQDQLFTLFYRTPDARKSSTQGTGIGLYVSKQIVELHDGHVGLESSPGKGTTVTVRLPGVSTSPNQAPAPAAERAYRSSFDDLEDAV